MTYQKRQRIMTRILSRTLWTQLKFKGETYLIKNIDPSLDVVGEAMFFYDLAWQEGKKQGIPTIKETYEILRNIGEWSDEQEERLKMLNKNIKDFQKKLNELQYQKAKHRAVVKSISEMRRQRERLDTKKNSQINNSLEMYCQNIYNEIVVPKCTEVSVNGNKRQDLLDNDTFLNELIVLINREDSSITESMIREVARTSPFRISWKTAIESHTPLLKQSTSELSDLEKSLCMWAMTYDMAFNSQDRPSDSVIHDDDAFDAWFDNQQKNKPQSQKNNDGDLNETFIVSDREGAKEVYELNDDQGKAAFRNRKKTVKEKGEAKDIDFSDVRANLMMKKNKV